MMSKYSNVSAESLKNTIESALNELPIYSLETIKANLTNSDVLYSSITGVIKTKTDEIMASSKIGSVSTLKKNLTTLKTACEHIIRIQTLEKEIKNLKAEIVELEKHKYKTEIYSYIDDYGEEYEEERTILDQGVVNQINAKSNLIATKTRNITTLEKTIDNLLSH